MVTSINTNLMASNSSHAVNRHYSELAKSTQRLSSGLRINSAADDAAGLAIRELMRIDVAALNQGVRNANDAISMLQTFDGALGIIDEKLIRMKELAEQAATGTYDSTQRLMIDSEFQAMGAEIDRIANATEFNGIKLINGSDKGEEIKISLEGNYKCLAFDTSIAKEASIINKWNTDGITDPSLLAGEYDIEIKNDYVIKLNDKISLVYTRGTTFYSDSDYTFEFKDGEWDIQGEHITKTFKVYYRDNGFQYVGFENYNTHSMWFYYIDNDTGELATIDRNTLEDMTITWHTPPAHDQSNTYLDVKWLQNPSYSSNIGTVTAKTSDVWYPDRFPETLDVILDLDPINNPGINTISAKFDISTTSHLAVGNLKLRLNVHNSELLDNISRPDYAIPENVTRIHFGENATKFEDFYDINKTDATLEGLGLSGVKIKTQDEAQQALTKVNDAIIEKDKIRAYYGTMQNRLENTITNLTTQAENLQAAESRISDADIATEMTTFVRNQILTQSTVAMLSQANSLPQMVMQLIR